MTSPRFHLPGLLEKGEVTLPREVTRHLRRVLRLEPGAQVILFDGQGLEVAAILLEKGAQIIHQLTPRDQDLPHRIAAFSPPRGERLEWLAEKATELGVNELILLATARTPPSSRQVKLPRLVKIMAGACAQCGRSRLPVILGPMSLVDFLAKPSLPENRILLDPRGEPLRGSAGPAVILAGPEGGFTPAEREEILTAGFTTAGLGKLTLRIETAITVALGVNPGGGGKLTPV